MSDTDPPVSGKIDTNRPDPARIYDAMLGGKDNFDVDRALLARLRERYPDLDLAPRENRKWLGRVVNWLCKEAGIDQFVDAGSGLPTVDNTHQIAARANPDAKVVYVDNNPVVIAHGRALLEDHDHTIFVAADLTEPDDLFAHRAVREHLELDRPVALLQCATFHFVPDPLAADAMKRYAALLPSGSYLALTHMRALEPSHPEYESSQWGIQEYRHDVDPHYTPRTTDEVEALFTGFELVDPGVVPIVDWWPEGPDVSPRPLAFDMMLGGLARKP